MRSLAFICGYFIFTICLSRSLTAILKSESNSYSTDIAKEADDRLLLFSTLEGTLVAIDQQTGEIQWKVKDKPTVTVPLDVTDAITPLFLPDPRDGSLYLLGDGKEFLKKLPFTIPQLVASSPCRSSDGILYTGKKKDTWFILDPKTGQKQFILGFEERSTCPISNVKGVYVGRTQYSVMMIDSKDIQRKWNVTFYDYTANSVDKEMLQNYDLVHFASTSTGRVVGMDRTRGSLLWDIDLGSPVVAIYVLDPEGLLRLPFTNMANHTIAHLATHLLTHQQPFQHQPSHMKLYPTVYIGQHVHGLYALPSLVDQNMVTITASEMGPLLLEGPDAPKCIQMYQTYSIPGENYHILQNAEKQDYFTFQSIPNKRYTIIYLGHYNIPDYSFNRLFIDGQNTIDTKLITDESMDKTGQTSQFGITNPDINKEEKDVTDTVTESMVDVDTLYVSNNTFYNIFEMISDGFNYILQCYNEQTNEVVKFGFIIVVGWMIFMTWYFRLRIKEMKQLSQSGSRSSQSNSVGRYGPITAVLEELSDGRVQVGKITFHPEELLGKGCEGTFVYRGEFDKRQVAVKRVLPECFTFADREVALLRESDAHPNVIRYFCTEQDRMFRFIALELCQFTLYDYVMKKCDITTISPLDILKQATSGLAHLHSLDIVHRDIKPHNVLLSMPDSKGEVRAMISDFGLCKKLQVGRVSFSRRSGITGTDGWIAPEMLNRNERTTCAVDMFSLGCLFYYVLSDGEHPFGDALRRQANILGNISNLEGLKGSPWQIALQKTLINTLISSQPYDRPSCTAVLMHPMFWNSSKILAFFQDVSDRIEKADLDDIVLKTLEQGATFVVRGNWRQFIHEEVAMDLRKYRSYRGESIRDLLRALRNKKHHYRDLIPEAQQLLGGIPAGFTNYWTSRFPLLLVHTWLSMQIVASESTFTTYYHYCHRYSLINYKDKEGILYPIYSPDLLNPDYSSNTILPNVDYNSCSKRKFDSSQDFSNYNKNFQKPQKYTIADQYSRKYKQNSNNYMRNIGTQPDIDENEGDTNHNYAIDNTNDDKTIGLYRNNNSKFVQNGSPKYRLYNKAVSYASVLSEEDKNFNDSVDKNSDTFVKQRFTVKNKKTGKKSDQPLKWIVPSDRKKNY